MPRLFVAVDAPEHAKDALAGLRRETPGIKWVPKEQLHLTLRFIGDFDDPQQIASVLRPIALPRFELTLAGVGQFPPKKPARVLWAGVHPVQEISALAAAVDRAVAGAGVAREDRPFSPHLTLARIKDAPRAWAASFLEAHKNFALAPFEVSAFVLYESVLSSKGATHTVLESFPLGAR